MTRTIIPFVLILGLLGTAPGLAQFTPQGGGGMGHHGGPGGGDQKDLEAWEAIRDEFKSMRKELDERIKAAIGDDKYKEYSKRMKDREKLVESRMGGPNGW